MWDNMLISGGNFKDGGITQHWEINLLDKNTNSLKQLNTYIGIMGSIQEKKDKQKVADWGMDEVTLTPATTDTTGSLK